LKGLFSFLTKKTVANEKPCSLDGLTDAISKKANKPFSNRPLSIFDLDHTLLNTNCSFRFGFFLYKKKFSPLTPLLRCVTYYIRHKWFGLSIENLHYKSFDLLFKGKSQKIVDDYVKEFLDSELEGMINSSILFLLLDTIKRGDYCAIFSGSPDFLVVPIATRWGVNPCEATTYHIDKQGRFTSIKHILEGREKAKALKELVNELGVDLSAVTIYSDSILDLPLLEMGGEAVAVFPDKKLRKICKRNNWQILE
jgi:HAD superfamily hydrolase (TIGR01490 family)